MDFSTSTTLPNSASPQHNPQAASVFGLHEFSFSSIEPIPNAKAAMSVSSKSTAWRCFYSVQFRDKINFLEKNLLISTLFTNFAQFFYNKITIYYYEKVFCNLAAASMHCYFCTCSQCLCTF